MYYNNGKCGFGYEKSTKNNWGNEEGSNWSISSYYGSYSCDNNLIFHTKTLEYLEEDHNQFRRALNIHNQLHHLCYIATK